MGNAAGTATRLLLIETAEHLFAQRGIDNVSLREIGEAAGQRNTAAISYHFGGRDELLRAILDHRQEAILQRSIVLFDLAMASTEVGTPERAYELMAAYVLPYAETYAAGGRDYITFLAHVQTDVHRPRDLMSVGRRERARRIFAALRPDVPPMSNAVYYGRTNMVVRVMLQGLSVRQRMAETSPEYALTWEAWVDDLIRVCVSILFTPGPPEGTRLRSGIGPLHP